MDDGTWREAGGHQQKGRKWGKDKKKKKVLNKIKTSERVCLEYCNNTAVGDN